MAGSDRIGKKPFRPHQGRATTFRSYVKQNQPEVTEFEPDPELEAVPKDEDTAAVDGDLLKQEVDK